MVRVFFFSSLSPSSYRFFLDCFSYPLFIVEEILPINNKEKSNNIGCPRSLCS